MRRLLIMIGSMLLLTMVLNANERSIRNYQENFCKDVPTAKLQEQYKRVSTEQDAMISHGTEVCSNATDTFNTQEAKRVGRKLYDDCESYRHGKVRKEIHKNKVVIKAIERELKSRDAFQQ